MSRAVKRALRIARRIGKKYAEGGVVDEQPLMDQAKRDYPILGKYDIGYKNNTGGGDGYLESWPPGEPGTPERPRPPEFQQHQFGIENYRADTRPIDIAGDVASHHLINVDPTIKKTYRDFTGSLEPWQNDILKRQYLHARQNEGESRSFDNWKRLTGLPAYFRGYTFQQWPSEFNQRAYTPKQRQLLDSVTKYLQGGAEEFADGGRDPIGRLINRDKIDEFAANIQRRAYPPEVLPEGRGGPPSAAYNDDMVYEPESISQNYGLAPWWSASKTFADGGVADPEDEALAFADRPQMVTEEDLAQAEINKKAAPRQGGLMQTIPQFAGMVQTPEGRSKLTEGARRWFTGDEKGEDKSWVPSPTENPIVKPVVEMVKGPREAMEGKMDREQMADWGAGTAMSLVGQGTFSAYAKPKGDIGVFGGRGSSMADHGALAKAEQMETKGVNRDQIWRDTGWGRDTSGEWMYHHDVSKAKLADLPQHPYYPDNVWIPEGRTAKLETVLPDPGLYKAYPFLKDYAVVGHDSLGIADSLGVLFDKQKTIAVSPQQPGSMFNTLIHEINHAIQNHEKFAGGGSQEMFLPKQYRETALALKNQEKLLNKYLKDQKIPIKDAWDAMYQVVHDPASVNARQEKLIDKVVKGGGYDTLADFIEKTRLHADLRKEAQSNYYRLAGEVSSRNAEFRARMTPEESRQMTPWESQTKMKRPIVPGKELTVEFASPAREQHSAKDDDQHIPQRMTPAEAKRWIRENTLANDPVDMWGYSNPEDYITLAERMQEMQRDPTGHARRMNEEFARRQQGENFETPEPPEHRLLKDPITKAYLEMEAARRDLARPLTGPNIQEQARRLNERYQEAERNYNDIVEKDRQISSYDQRHASEQRLAGDPFAEASDLTGGTPYEPPTPQPLTLERLMVDFTPERIRQLSYQDLAHANSEIKELVASKPELLEEVQQRYPQEFNALEDHLHSLAMEEYASRDFAPLDAESGVTPPTPPHVRSEPRLAHNSLVANFDKYLAPHFENTDAFINNFLGGMANPRDVTMAWSPHGGFVVQSELRNKAGRIIGSVSRQFNPETKSAYHAYLRIDEGERGKGSIPAMLENQINLYRKLGIENVKLGANIDVGGYAWAKYGFIPQKFEWAYMADRFKDMIATGQVRISRNIPRNKNYSPYDAVMEVLNNPEPEAIWHLTDLKIQAAPNKSIGKFFLLNTSWGGTLHLTRPDALSRFQEYVAVRKKAHEKR